MKHHAALTLLVLVTTTCRIASGPSSTPDLILAQGGVSELKIVVSPAAEAPVRFAAEELLRYLSQISSIDILVTTGPARGPSIRVGLDDEGKVHDSLRGRPEDSFLVWVDEETLHLGGNTPRGTLYSVYYFLEKYLDCGWIKPGEDVVPKRDSIVLAGDTRDIQSPDFSHRSVNLYPFIADRNLRNVDWAAKNRLNWIHACANSSQLWEELDSRSELVPEIEKRGLLINYGGHTFHKWVPPAQYFSSHPEYFSVLDGKRDSRQLCISNQEVAEVAAQNINSFLDQNPEIDMVDVWLSDVIEWCECGPCEEMEGGKRISVFDLRGSVESRSDSNIMFINRIAEGVAARHPEVLVQTLAYFMLMDAPLRVTPAPNVMVGFAPIMRQPSQKVINRTGYWYAIYDPRHEVNRSRLREIRKWLEIIDPKRFFTYEYYSHFSTALAMIKQETAAENLEAKLIDPSQRTFHVYSDTVAKDIWYYTQIGMEGLGSEEWDWNEINMYFYPRLLWDPGRSSVSLLEEYCSRAYGQAAEPMTLHWLILQESREKYPAEKSRCLAMLDQAEQMTQDGDVLRRIGELREIWSHIPSG